MSFEFLFSPVEDLDAWLGGLVDGAPLAVALGLAFVLGLRHASDPDHLVAVSTLMAGEERGLLSSDAARIGAWWGLGHAATLLAIGLPLIALESELPGWLETAAERLVGVIILALAARVLWKWLRGDYRARAHGHGPPAEASEHRHLHAGPRHAHTAPRSPRQAFGIGVAHGLAGTGAIVVLLIAALPGRLEAAAALAVFAPMSIVSMAGLTAGFAWILTRRRVDPVFRRVAIPLLALFGLGFGFWVATG